MSVFFVGLAVKSSNQKKIQKFMMAEDIGKIIIHKLFNRNNIFVITVNLKHLNHLNIVKTTTSLNFFLTTFSIKFYSAFYKGTVGTNVYIKNIESN